MKEEPGSGYDAIIIAVNHREYLDLTAEDFKSLSNGSAVLVDVKSIYLEQFKTNRTA
jgi:UDP-N-acetyl-D-glucosamine/UDP-N-acetyl-D-galactosamine dehydrogenase